MDSEMEYVPINNIKQEVESATHNNQEVESPSTGLSSKSGSNNNSQAAPDSAENKVSTTMGGFQIIKTER